MLRKVEVADAGDTRLIRGDQVAKARMLEGRERAVAAGKLPGRHAPMLHGNTKASKATENFITAATESTQEVSWNEAAEMKD